MNINTTKGDRVRVDNLTSGYLPDQKIANQYLKLGDVYTVEKTVVYEWHTDVFLQEFPGVAFNSCFFEDE